MEKHNGHSNGGWYRTIKVTAAITLLLSPLLLFEPTYMLIISWWGAAGYFIQEWLWGALYDKLDGDPFIMGFWGLIAASNIVFFTAASLLSLVDLTGKPAFLLRYKIQDDKNAPLDPKRLKSAIKVVIFNQTVIGLPMNYLLFHIGNWRGCELSRQLPTFSRFLFEYVVCVLVEEVVFYYSHRMLHHPALYKTIHKKHHEWTAPISWVTLYAHPIEHVFSNVLPVFAGPLLCGAHQFTVWVWVITALLTSMVTHCGYHFPFLMSPEAHDYHHLKFNQCYGVLGILDDLHGTNTQFKASIQFKKHYCSLGLTPLQNFYRDTTATKKTH